MTGVRHMAILCILILCGCDGRLPEAESAEGGGGRPALEMREISRSIQTLDECLMSSGIAASRRGEDVARHVAALPDDVRGRAASLFIGRLEAIGGSLADFGIRPRPLRNFQGLLKSADLCVSSPEDVERVMGLCLLCLGRYREALAACQTRKDAEGRALRRELETDRRLFVETVRKVYLPLVSARRLPPERHAYWTKTIAREIDEGLDVSETSLDGIRRKAEVMQ